MNVSSCDRSILKYSYYFSSVLYSKSKSLYELGYIFFLEMNLTKSSATLGPGCLPCCLELQGVSMIEEGFCQYILVVLRYSH